MRLDGDVWREFFDSYEREAFRLETLSTYAMPAEDDHLREWRETGQVTTPDDDQWMVRLRKFRDTGRWIGRVHVVRRPLSEYLRFELAAYEHNARNGEVIRILDATGPGDLGLPNTDFWMFDEERVVEMLYNPDGTQIGRELLDDPDIGQYRQWKHIAMDLSVPLEEFQVE